MSYASEDLGLDGRMCLNPRVAQSCRMKTFATWDRVISAKGLRAW
jgi:hypothetical protein